VGEAPRQKEEEAGGRLRGLDGAASSDGIGASLRSRHTPFVLRRLALLLVAASACRAAAQADVPPVAYTGSLPATVAARYLSNVLTVEAQVNGASARPLLVDTGSAMTGVDPNAYADANIPSDASSLASLVAGGLTWKDVPSVALDECGATCGPYDVTGVLGGNVLRSFVVSFDYRAPAVVFGASPPPSTVTPTPIVVPFSVEGGGMGTISGGNGEEVDVPPTRLVVHATVEGAARTFVVDTGASFTLLRQTLFDTLVSDGRTKLALQSSTASGSSQGSVARTHALGVGAATSSGSPVESVADNVVDNLASETGASIDGLLGGSFLRAYDAVVDYGAGTLSLYAYTTVDPLADEFDRVGFFLAPSGSDYVVVQIVPMSAASQIDGLEGSTLVDVDGTALAGLDPETADRLLRGAVGATHTMHVMRAAALEAETLPVEDVLALP
jgi:Aspartyl protease